MKHLSDSVKEFILAIKKKFKGIHIDGRPERGYTREEVVPSEMNDSQYDDWKRDYACFTIDADLSGSFPGPAHAYEYHEIDSWGFYRDLKDFVQELAGSDVTVNFSDGCGEFELIREKK